MRPNLCTLAVAVWLTALTAQIWGQDDTQGNQAKRPEKAARSAQDEKPPAKVTDEDIAAEFKKLSGTWRPDWGELAGNKLPDEVCAGILLEMGEGTYRTVANGVESTGKIVLDLAKDPRTMDITLGDGPDAGKSLKCIYKFVDDELHVAYSLAFDDVRPTEFESNQDNKLLLFIYKRDEESEKSADKSEDKSDKPAETKRDK